MKKWYVKEFGQLTNISVRTLHHYDAIGLLKPSLRSSAGYRLYSEQDLLKLQRIVALKFFGLNLKQIKHVVEQDEDVISHLSVQRECLNGQILRLNRASKTLGELIAAAAANKTIDWSKVLNLIEDYDMSKHLSQEWVVRTFSPDQIEQFAKLEKKYTKDQMADYQRRWEEVQKRVEANLDLDPKSLAAQKLHREFNAVYDEMYGSTPELRDALTLAYRHNKIPHQPFNKKVWDFLEAAAKHAKN